MRIKEKILKIFVPVFLGAVLLTGCPEQKTVQNEEYLLKVSESILTVKDFHRAFDMARAAYSYRDLQDKTTLNRARADLLEQLTERMVVLSRAKESGIIITDPEVQRSVKEIKTGYPKGEFEKSLMENAISYDYWEDELRIRLLMEKVIRAEVQIKAVVSPEEIKKFRESMSKGSKKSKGDKPDDELIRQLLLKQKTEELYGSWIKGLYEKYPVSINKKKWDEITKNNDR